MIKSINRQGTTKVLSAVFSSLFVYQAAFGYWEAHISRGIYILFALVLTFLINPNRKQESSRFMRSFDYVLVGLSVFVTFYFMINFNSFAVNAGLPLSTIDVLIGCVTVLLVLEACRRTLGLAIPIIAISFLLYNYFGQYMPDIIFHRGFSINRIISVMYASTEGIFGSVAYTFSSFIFLFIIFGTFIQASGAGDFFVDLSKALVGRFAGGSAQAAVVSSALLGSIMGSSTANTAVSGGVTIPLMIDNGYKKHIAASVSAVSSIGGQFLPPVMGAGAFLMASFIGVPYIEIAKTSVIPALLFFLGIGIMVYLEAKNNGLKGIPKEEIPKISDVLKKGWFYLIPIVIIVFMLMKGFSPSLAGFWGIGSSFIVSFFRKEKRMKPKALYEALSESAKSSLAMATTAGVVGLLVAAISLPGLGMKFSSIILELANGRLFIALLLVMAASFVLGMGMNVTSAYMVLVTLAAPALVELGVPLIAAHFFVFWTSQLSVVTPPVCLSAYVAASIAGADPWKTGWYSLRMGLSIYYLPLMFIYVPPIILIGSPGQIILATVTALLGILCYSVVSQGYFITRAKIYERIILGIAAMLLIIYGVYTDLIGLALLALVIALQLSRKKREEMVVTESEVL